MTTERKRFENPPEMDRYDEEILDRIHDRLGAERAAEMRAQVGDEPTGRSVPGRLPPEPYIPPSRR